nr:ABC transporter ATP-binding protein [Maliibacterium massiliense]
MIKKLAPFMKKHRVFAILAPVTVIAEVLLEIRIPLLMAQIVDIGIPARDMGYVLRTGGLMVLFALLALLCGALSSRFASRASMGFGSELRGGLFNAVQDYAFGNIDKYATASLVTRLTTDVNNVQMSYMMIIRMLVRAPVMLVSAIIMAMHINASLVSVFLVAVPVLACALFTIATTAYPRFRAMLKKYDGMNASVQENLIAIRVVKAFVRAKYEKDKFKLANDDLKNASKRAEKIIIWNVPMMQLTMYSCIIAILWFGGNMIIAGGMLTGELISFISYVTQILMSLMMISMVFISLVLSRASLQRIVEVLSEQPDITDEAADPDARVQQGSVTFQDVCFKYDANAQEDTLSHINLTIKAGQTVGIIGGTGSAKSTLVQLIARLYDAASGRVLVDGRDVRCYTLEHLRDAVGMVLQKNVLFSGTIRDNLKWGNAHATDEQIVDACKAAQAHDFIMAFPDGYDTDLGQGGVNVSGGQKQRLCIARALLKNPKVLILDDSTSAVDTATDANIRQALRTRMRDTTAIIIAQRVTSVMDADMIVVMDDGRIDAVGTHDELLATNEIYREVYASQQKGVA